MGPTLGNEAGTAIASRPMTGAEVELMEWCAGHRNEQNPSDKGDGICSSETGVGEEPTNPAAAKQDESQIRPADIVNRQGSTQLQ